MFTKTKKSIGAALACALALGAWSGSALATNLVTVDGITWDTDSPLNLKIQGIDLRETAVDSVGDVLKGYGVIGSINGDTTFCSGCSLNFTFSYTVSHLIGTNKIIFDLGSLNLYADPTGSFNETDPTTAGIGNLWLSLTGHTAKFQNFPFTGQLFSVVTGSVGHPGNNSGGFGLLDTTGAGDAYTYIMQDIYPDGLGGLADFNLSSSFSFQLPASCSGVSSNPNSVCHYPIAGTGTLLNQMLPVAVPEPAEIGLLGLGLGVLGLLLRRRRKDEAEGLS